MEDKIEVNEYVRTKEGFIYRVENGEEFYEDSIDVGIGTFPDVEGIWVDKGCMNYIDKRDVVKHSKQLIDLIECEDFVNGYKVISVDYDVMNDTTECIELDLNSNYQYNFISIRQIKTILTHEQFEDNCYKGGGEDDN